MAMQAAVFVTHLLGCAARQPLWVSATAPITGDIFEGGLSMVAGGDLMLEEIQNNPSILPDYDLKLLCQDDRCTQNYARNIFLQNLFEETYKAFAPGVPFSGLDVDGDKDVSSADTDLLEQVWNRTQVNPRPVAYLGQGCSGGTGSVVSIAYYAQVPFIAPVATFPGLSDRSVYPNFFRTALPDSFSYFALAEMVSFLGHKEMVVLTGTTGGFPYAAQKLAEFARAANITLLGRALDNGFTGYNLPSDSQAAIADIVTELIKHQVRFVMILEYLKPVAGVVCEAMKRGYTTAVYMTIGWLEFGWWTRGFQPPGSQACTAKQMQDGATGLLMAKMVYWRLDQQTKLSCASNLTMRTFYERWFARLGAPFGQLARVDWGYTLYDDGGAYADAVCMMALALHQMLYVRNFSLTDLVDRTTEAYLAFQEVFAHTDFEGVTGRVSFEPGKSDPVASVIIQQVRADGSVLNVATYRGSGVPPGAFTWLDEGNLKFQFPGEEIRADGSRSSLATFETCKGTQTLNFTSNTCQNCSANTRFLPLSRKCLCAEGYYSPQGTGEVPCLPCSKGSFSSILGSTECELCPVGKHAPDESLTDCPFCAVGNYSNSTGAAECKSCPEGQTTQNIASQTVASCLCDRSSYQVQGSETCNFCPPGASTAALGASSIKSCFCPEEMYMNARLECAACPSHMTCPVGSNAANGIPEILELSVSMRTQEQVYMEVNEGYWSSVAAPLEIYKCNSKRRCPGGSPGSACAAKLEGIACEHCVKDYLWDGISCVECAGVQSNLLVFPTLPILLLLALIVALYRFFGDPYPKWNSWQNAISAVLFITLNHYQILGTLGTFKNISVPKVLREALDRFEATNSVSLGFGLACVGLDELIPSMIAKAIAPVLVMLATCTVYFGSLLLAQILQRSELEMERNRLQNVVGSLMFTFFGAISAMSLALFRCSNNPSGNPTLAVDLSVLCWRSDTWTKALGIGIVCVLLYIIGMGGVFLQAIFRAPQFFRNADFQMRWKFLFIKFHAGAYWWGMVFLGKNFTINFIPVIVTSEVARLYLSMTAIILYLAAVSYKMPYRSTVANVFEVLAGISILYLSSLLTWFVEEEDGQEEYEEERLAMSAVVISLSPAALLPLGMVWLSIRGKGALPTPAQRQKAENQLQSLRESYTVFSALDANEATSIILHMSEGDRRILRAAEFLLRTDVFGIQSAKRVAGDRSSIVKRFTRAMRRSGREAEEAKKVSLASQPVAETHRQWV